MQTFIKIVTPTENGLHNICDVVSISPDTVEKEDGTKKYYVCVYLRQDNIKYEVESLKEASQTIENIYIEG